MVVIVEVMASWLGFGLVIGEGWRGLYLCP